MIMTFIIFSGILLFIQFNNFIAKGRIQKEYKLNDILRYFIKENKNIIIWLLILSLILSSLIELVKYLLCN